MPGARQQLGAGITACGWSYRYPGRARPALAEVTVEVAPGSLVVLIGASGSGKSTLLAALAGTLPEGEATGRIELSPTDGRRGLVQQEPEGNLVMERVGDEVAFPLENVAVPPERIWAQVRAALRAVGLAVPLTALTDRLSGGQQQLLALAAAQVGAPAVLLLDEPTANLDPESAAAVVSAVAAMRAASGCTVVVVEHRVEPWLARADLVLLVEAGRVTAHAPAAIAALLEAHPALAARVWLDHAHLPSRPPRGEPGSRVLEAANLAVDGRLAPTDLLVRAGEVVAVTGPPGSGKSTLLACLGGLLAPSAGSLRVRVGGGAAWREAPWTWPPASVARTFGTVFQNPEHQFLTGSVRDELAHGTSGSPERVAALLARLHLAGLAEADPWTLSGGEQRRLSVGTALAAGPAVLLLDEPTFGQDPATWAEVVDMIAEHRDAGGAVVLATHDPHLVSALGAREVRLRGVAQSAESTVTSVGPGSPAEVPLLPARGLRSLDPLALLAGAGLWSLAGLASGSVALNLLLAALALAVGLLGAVGGRRVAALAVPAVVASASVALSNALLSGAGLTSAAAWQAAALPASRVLAVALPGLLAAVATDPIRLADALVARVRVPARAAYAVLAALRLLPLLAEEWAILGRASRARGVGDRGVRARALWFLSMTFRLLVAALRRGARLAVALDVRGLRSGQPRTCARPVRWRGRDTVAVLVGGVALAAALLGPLGG
ncbi:MAG TPA: ATP-binding cassette domain-containing protein [Candidatus Nanopelagicales bacterium]